MESLELSDITFGYADGNPILDHVSLQVGADECVVVTAPSGFGKTTLCRIASGYLAPWEGTVSIGGVALPDKGACPVQLIWQHPEQALDPLIPIRSSLQEAGPIDETLLSDLGVRREWLTRFPRELSGGELQRCAIARALAVAPRFLVADEISTMLDAITQAQIWRFLKRYCAENGVGMLAVTHSGALEARIATRTVSLLS